MAISAVGSVSPAGALNQISLVVSQLRLPGVSPQTEATLEQQLVKAISSTNPSANWSTIAWIANDIADPFVSTAAANIDVAALDRMVVPTAGSTGLTSAIDTIAGQLRNQSPLPAGVTTLSADGLANSKTVTLSSTNGMFNGDTVAIQLNDGSIFHTKITTISGNTANLADRLPSQASTGTSFTDTAQQLRVASSTSSKSSPQSIATSLTATAATSSTTLKIASATGMYTGDAVTIPLSDGSTLETTITSISGSASLAATALASATAVTLTSAAGMNSGDAVKIQLDNGTVFNTTIASVAGNVVNIAAPLPSQASTGSSFTDPSNVQVTIATPLPVSAALGGSFTDTSNIKQSANTINFSTPLTADALTGATNLTVTSVGGMAIGDTVQIQLTNGSVFNTEISNISGTIVTIAGGLPSQALTGSTITDTVSTFQPTGGAFIPAVHIAPQMQDVLQLQLNILINNANPSADTNKLQTLEASLAGSTLTSAEFQQDLALLVQEAVKGLKSGTSLSILA